MVGIGTRTTMDLDATIKGQTLTETEIIDIVNEIINIPIEDNVIFKFKGIEEIREEAEYPGYRVSIETLFDKIRQIIKVDITTGDFVTPREIEYRFKLLLEDREIPIIAYNIETVLAEKFESIITRGLTNTRMRDFYDIYILTMTQPFDTVIFHQALEKAALKRNTTEQMMNPEKTIQRIFTSDIMTELWNRYQKKYSYATDISWEMEIALIKI